MQVKAVNKELKIYKERVLNNTIEITDSKSN